MELHIDTDKCIGCRKCVEADPNMFKIGNDNKAHVDQFWQGDLSVIPVFFIETLIIPVCPMKAIFLIEPTHSH